LKILQINTVCGIGSTGRIVNDLANELNKQGDICYIAYGQHQNNYNNSFKIGTTIENHLHNIGSRLFDKQGFFSNAGTYKLIAYIKENLPDIIHLHNLHGNYINIDILFKFLEVAEIPVIWTLHDCWPFTGHCAYFDYIDCHKWETHCNKCLLTHSYPPSIFIDNSEDNFENKRTLFNLVKDLTIVTPSSWLAGLVKKSYLARYEVMVINNGIDTNVFNIQKTEALKAQLGLNDSIILLGVSAEGFEGRKGLKYFIELANSLDNRFKILLIGCTESDIKKLPKTVIALKRTESIKQLSEYYSMADIFINPTLEDNFPTTNLEALACGTPIITFNTGGSPEVVDISTGIIIQKSDSIGLLNAILSMNNQFKKNNSFFCRNKAVNNFDKKNMYQKYLQLYQSNLNT